MNQFFYRFIVSPVLGIFLLLFMATGYGDTIVARDIVYGHKDGMALVYDVLMPKKANGAAIVNIMSGEWFSTHRDPDRVKGWFKAELDEGFTVFAVYHGSAPRYKVPEAYADVSRAIRHIKKSANDFGIDPDRIGVTGGSAGGHLALMVGLDSDDGLPDSADEVLRQDNRIAAVVANYPPVDIRNSVGTRLGRFPALDFDKDLAAAISPILFVSRDDPPTLLVHGNQDTLVSDDNSKRILAALEKQKVTSKLVIIKGGDHGFRNPSHRNQANDARIAWFRKYLVVP